MEGQVNYLAVLAAAVSTFLIGGLWYSPLLFKRTWMEANGLTDQDLEKGNPTKIFGLSFLFALVMSLNLAMFLADESTTAAWGATAGLLAGLGWVAMAIATVGLFEQRSWKYILVNSGNQIVGFVVMGWILGVWR